MMTSVSTLKPGLLVSLRTSLAGNIRYRAQEIEADHIDPTTGARRAKWETERVITDPEEHELAVKARGKARSLITGVCAQSAFGLLCPVDAEDKLEQAMREARDVAEAFNVRASLTRISVNVIVGRIAADDVEAVRAINSEVRELLERMERGVRNLDVEAIRDSANKAKALVSMLSPTASQRAEEAIKAARSVARRIVKAGETAAVEVDAIAIETVRNSRLAFLDLDDAAEIQAPMATAAALDFAAETVTVESEERDEPEEEAEQAAPPEIELDEPPVVAPVIVPARRPSIFADF
jgi:hypothetical protein